MVIYIITKCGKTLKDEAIQYLLERIALTGNKKKYFYICPDVNSPHHKIVRQFEALKAEYKVLFYNTMDDWAILNDSEMDAFTKELKQPLNWEIPLHKILSKVITSK
jgi:hypothetical protein